MNRLRLKMRFASGGLHELCCIRQIEVDQLSTIVADRVVVPVSFTIVATGAISKTDFKHESGFFQVAQRVVNGCVTDTGQTPARGLKNIACRRVVVTLQDDLVNRLPLRRQLRFFLCVLHDGFRLILNPWIVKRRVQSSSFSLSAGKEQPKGLTLNLKHRMMPSVVDDVVHIALEGWAVDAVWGEKLPGLARVVELLDEEVGNGVVR